MLRNILLVGIGGALGSIARYGVGLLMNKYFNKPFPVATLTVNLAGCFLIGLMYGFVQRQHTNDTTLWLWLLLVTGFCGGFTTFSSFALENNNMLGNNSMTALIYTISSIVLGILLCRLGVMLNG